MKNILILQLFWLFKNRYDDKENQIINKPISLGRILILKWGDLLFRTFKDKLLLILCDLGEENLGIDNLLL